MNFKDLASADLSTFFNLDEFASLHDIDGVELPAIVDTDILMGRPRRSSAYLYDATQGVYMDQVLLFVREVDLGERPVSGQTLRLDGQLYEISSCFENAGVLEITLEGNRS